MYVTLITNYVREDKVQNWLNTWTEEVYPRIMQIPGLIAGYILTDRPVGTIVNIQFWNSEKSAHDALWTNSKFDEWAQIFKNFASADPDIEYYDEENSYGYIGMFAGAK